jgi:hypothetical protein
MPPDMAVELPRTPPHQPTATHIIVFQPSASALASGCTAASASAPVMCQSGCSPVECASRMRPSAHGAARSANRLPISPGVGDLGQGRRGTWTRSCARSMVNGTICGGPWIRRGMSAIAWCNGGATSRPPRRASGTRLEVSARFRDTTIRGGPQGTSGCPSPARRAGPQERRGLCTRLAGDSGMPVAAVHWRGVLCRPIMTRDPHR